MLKVGKVKNLEKKSVADNKKHPTYPTKISLAMLSGNQCAMPDCHKLLKEKNSNNRNIGKAAHIYGLNEDSARYKADMTDEERNHIDNLLYLCPNCHEKVDETNPEDYPVEYLIKIKKEHQKSAFETTERSMSEVGFAELEVVVKAVVSAAHYDASNTFEITPPKEKMEKNKFTNTLKNFITPAFMKTSEVKQYIKTFAQAYPKFPERLAQGFKNKYNELSNTYSGDALFWKIYEFANDGRQGEVEKAAALAIIVYFFEACEIFEK